MPSSTKVVGSGIDAVPLIVVFGVKTGKRHGENRAHRNTCPSAAYKKIDRIIRTGKTREGIGCVHGDEGSEKRQTISGQWSTLHLVGYKMVVLESRTADIY